MSSPDLGLPYIAQSQVQAEATHNASLLLLQALANGVISVGGNTPPGSPVDGDAYVVGPAPTGVWAGRANAIAIYLGGWFFLPDRNTAGTIIAPGARHQGLSVYNRTTGRVHTWSGTAWQSGATSPAVVEGSNAAMGVATLVAGTVTVSTTRVTANSRIFLAAQSLGTVTAPKALAITARTAGTSFTITSADATDTSLIAWQIIEPA